MSNFQQQPTLWNYLKQSVECVRELTQEEYGEDFEPFSYFDDGSVKLDLPSKSLDHLDHCMGLPIDAPDISVIPGNDFNKWKKIWKRKRKGCGPAPSHEEQFAWKLGYTRRFWKDENAPKLSTKKKPKRLPQGMTAKRKTNER